MTKPSKPNVVARGLHSHSLTGAGSFLAKIKKAVSVLARAESKQGSLIGRVQPLIDYDNVAELKDQNPHHSAALDAKVAATVGLGHRDTTINETLNDMCVNNWAETLEAVVSDMYEFANGYLEVVRSDDGNIRGLYHLAAADVIIHLEENRNIFHYEIANSEAFRMTNSLHGLRFARFGDRDDFIERRQISAEQAPFVSEVIHFPMNRGRRSPYYGYPTWAAATPAIELDHCVTQYAFDFFFNGGVPEAIYNIIGKRMDPDDWEAIQNAFLSHTGIGNKRKVMLLNLGDPEMTAQLDKLTLDGQTTGDNQAMVDSQALKVLSAHRTPPILAGVTQPGKMGANNEVTNAMMLFQLLLVGPAQKFVSALLGCTLGNPEFNGDLGLTEDQFLGVGFGDQEPDPNNMEDPTAMRDVDHKGNGFNSIVDEIDLGKAETVGKMRMSVAESQARGRDLSQGVAERGSDVGAGRGDRS
jgi:hypothetical protein